MKNPVHEFDRENFKSVSKNIVMNDLKSLIKTNPYFSRNRYSQEVNLTLSK